MERRSLHVISDDELLASLVALLGRSRRTESDLVGHVAEVDARRLYTREAAPSMFAYCVEVLHLSEAEAYLRIAAGRASRQHPLLLEMLADGRLHLSGVGKLAPHLTRANSAALLARAAHKTKRQIEELIAEVAPRPDAPSVMRKLQQRPPTVAPGASPVCMPPLQDSPDCQSPSPPTPSLEGAAAAGLPRRSQAAETPQPGNRAASELRPDAAASLRPTAREVVEPLAPGRYRIQFTASATLKDKLERLQALMWPRVADGDLAALIEAAVTEKLERLEAKRFAKTTTPRSSLEQTTTAPTARRIPAAVRRAVYQRDGNRCRFVDGQGRRCSERTRLEFHHRYPFGHGGDHSPPNLALLCRAHNALMAEVDYGRKTLTWNRGQEAALRRPAVQHAPEQKVQATAAP